MIVRAVDKGGRGHIASAFSLVEIMRVLYDEVLSHNPADPDWPDRDRCILSKGHGCLALYVMLADQGYFDPAELDRFCHFDGLLGGHPEIVVPGVEASTGALGHGLSIGVGMAMAARLQRRPSRVYVVMGDGEINEGAVWEAAMTASKHRLGNLTAIVDYNKMQSYGPLDQVQPLEPLIDKWRSFGFAAYDVDGHDVDALRRGFASIDPDADRPTALICHTVKGRGVAAIEHDATWHHKSRLKPDELAMLHNGLGAA